MKKLFPVLLLLLFAILATIPLIPVLSDTDQVLAFNDGNIEAGLRPSNQYPEIFTSRYDNQFFFGRALAPREIKAITTFQCLLGPHQYRRVGPIFILALSALAGYWMLRQFALSRFASAFAAGVSMLSGFCYTFAINGLAVRAASLGWAALAVGFMERGRRRASWLCFAIAGSFVGLCVYESLDVGLILAAGCGFAFLWMQLSDFKKTIRWFLTTLGRSTLLLLFIVLMAYSMIASQYKENIRDVTQGTTTQTPEEKYEWSTQWSIPLAETWDMVAGSWFGVSSRSAELPYWGRTGRSAGWDTSHQGYRNFKLSGWHMGAIPSILLLSLFALLLGKRNGFPSREQKSPGWMVITGCILFLMLSWGKYFPMYRLVNALPIFSAIRNPDKWNGPFMLFAMLGIGFCVNRVETIFSNSSPEPRKQLIRVLMTVSVTIAGIALFLCVQQTANEQSLISRLQTEGYGEQAQALWGHSVGVSLFIFLLAGSFLTLIHLTSKGKIKRALFPVLLCVLTGIELLYTNSLYAEGHHYKQLLTPNPLCDYLDQHREDGRLKLLPPHHPLLNQMRMTLLMARGYDLFDPISTPRMPTDYAALFETLQQNPIRLWELGNIRYFLGMPGLVEQLNAADGNRGRFVERLELGVRADHGTYLPTSFAPVGQRPLRLVEFTGALPKYHTVSRTISMTDDEAGDRQTLKRLASATFNPAQEAVVCGNAPALEPAQTKIALLHEVSTSAELQVQTDQPVLLVRSEKHHPSWEVEIDGNSTELLRINYLFQGVVLPAGDHAVTFSFRPGRMFLLSGAGSRILLAIMLLIAPFSNRTQGVTAEDSSKPSGQSI